MKYRKTTTHKWCFPVWRLPFGARKWCVPVWRPVWRPRLARLKWCVPVWRPQVVCPRLAPSRLARLVWPLAPTVWPSGVSPFGADPFGETRLIVHRFWFKSPCQKSCSFFGMNLRE